MHGIRVLLWWALALVAPVAFATVGSPVQQLQRGSHLVDFTSTALQVRGIGGELSVSFVETDGVEPRFTDQGEVVYPDLWPGIELRYDTSEGILRSTWNLDPGIPAERIRMRYNQSLRLNQRGELELQRPLGMFTESAPIAWQWSNGERHPVAVSFRLIDDHTLGFSLGDYDPSLALTIDPTLSWSNHFGDGIGDTSKEQALNTIVIDGSGDLYMAGSAKASWSSGVTASSFHTGIDVYVMKVSATGAVVWDTYLGGAGDETAHAMLIDGSTLYIVGDTTTNDWPEYNSADSISGSNSDVFLARVDATNGSLTRLDYLGGSGSDTANGIVKTTENSTDYFYIVGSSDNDDWGATAVNAFAGGTAQDIFLAKTNINGDLQWFTMAGSTSSDSAASLTSDVISDGSGNLYVFGQSFASWGSPARAFTIGNGGSDAVIAKFNSSGARQAHTFLGGDGTDSAGQYRSIAISGTTLYVVGTSDSATWGDLTPAPENAHSGNQDIFLASVATANLSLDWYSFAGGPGNDVGTSVVPTLDGGLAFTGYSNADWGTYTSEPFNSASIAGVVGVMQAQDDSTSRKAGEMRNHVFVSYFTDGTGAYQNYEARDLVLGTNTTFLTGRAGSSVLDLSGDFPVYTPRYDAFGARFNEQIGLLVVLDGNTEISNNGLYDFGYVLSATTHDLTMKNAGDADLTVTDLAFGGQLYWNPDDSYPSLDPFSISAQPNFSNYTGTNGIMAPGEEIGFTVAFDPPSTDIYEGWADSYAGGSFYKVNLKGSSQPPIMSVSGNGQVISSGDTTPSTADHTEYGTLKVLSKLSRTFTITSTNGVVMNISNVAISGTNASDFQITKYPAASTDTSDTFTVQFYPTDGGRRTATVTITSDASNTPYTFDIAGWGAAIDVSPQTLSVNEAGSTSNLSLTITSTPTATVTVNLAFSGGEVQAKTTGAYSTTSASVQFLTSDIPGTTKTVTFQGINDGVVDLTSVTKVAITTSTTDPVYTTINPDDVSVQNYNRHYTTSCLNDPTPGPTFTSGTTVCKLESGTMDLTGVTVQSGANVGFYASTVSGMPTVSFQNGSNVQIGTNLSVLDTPK